METKKISPKLDQCVFEDYTIRTTMNHIMGTKCDHSVKCQIPSNSKPDQLQSNICDVCRFENELDLSSLPDMIFSKNRISIQHTNGGIVEFNALDALKQVGKHSNHIEVAHAKAWKAARADCEFATKVVKDFDWTYSTSYSGTVQGFQIKETDQRIDLEKLKIPEQILFYKEVYLYEDELDDNGSTKCTVKVRVMPSGFFVVYRHYLRVDHVLIRVCDTRLYYEKGKEGILREISLREAPVEQLTVDAETYKNPDLVWQYLTLMQEKVEKLTPD